MKMVIKVALLFAIGVAFFFCFLKEKRNSYQANKFSFYVLAMEKAYNLSREQKMKLKIIIEAWNLEMDKINKRNLMLNHKEVKEKIRQADLRLKERIEVIIGTHLNLNTSSNLGGF